MDQVLFLHNARPDTSLHPRVAIVAVVWTAVPHPPYSPDLAPSYFHLIGSLKDDLRRRRFANDSMREDLQRFSEEFYANVIHTLMQRWEKIVLIMKETL